MKRTSVNPSDWGRIFAIGTAMRCHIKRVLHCGPRRSSGSLANNRYRDRQAIDAGVSRVEVWLSG